MPQRMRPGARSGAYIAEQRKSFTFADVEFKGAQNLVSYVDKQTEKMIVERLRELTPDAGFITEEGTVTAAVEGQPLKWIVDPLDGTTISCTISRRIASASR